MTDKAIWLGRHAEGFHNVLMEYHLVDPGITARGKEQCRKLDSDTKDTAQKDVELVITSPLRRALQTTIHGLPTAIERLGGKSSLLVLPAAREVYLYPADLGTDPDKLAKDPEFEHIDFSSCQDRAWMSKTGFYSTTDSAIAARAKHVRRWLRERPEKHIILMSHGNFIRCLLYGRTRGPLLGNAEIRQFTFKSNTDDEAVLEEVKIAAQEGGDDEPTALEKAPRATDVPKTVRRRSASPGLSSGFSTISLSTSR